VNARALSSSQLKALAAAAGKQNLLHDASSCWAYGQDNSRQHRAPLAVVFATDHDQVARVLLTCNQLGLPVFTRGRGTGTAGGAVPTADGIVLSTERMDKILNVDPDNRAMTVQPGVLNQTVQNEAANFGLFWPPDPTSAAFCTVGGNLAVNSAGPRCLKYGTTRDNVLQLKAVSGDGRSLQTGEYTTKGVVGYDLTRLLIGSEGTLAVITEATLKLTPLPEEIRTLQLVYDSVNHAAAAVASIMRSSVLPRTIEFMDTAAINLIRNQPGMSFPETAAAILMVEVDGISASLDSAIEQILQSSVDGRIQHRLANTREEADQLWTARKILSPTLRNIAPNKLNEDVVVPVAEIANLISGLEQLSKQFDIPIVNFGHAGNGNIHVNLLYDTQNESQARQARPCLDAVFDLVLKLNGTISGEHGIGLVKREYVGRELGRNDLDIMQGIRKVFDPNGILNPGKIFPA